MAPGSKIVSSASLTFTPLDWSTPQTVTATGVDDAAPDGNVAYAIVLGPCTSTDPKDRRPRSAALVEANPELHEWHTVTYPGRLPGLKWLRTLWLASLAGGPFEYTGRELRDAHFDLKISPAVFDEVAAELSLTLDHFKVPEREKGEVLGAFAGWKGEVTAGSEPGSVNWRRWR